VVLTIAILIWLSWRLAVPALLALPILALSSYLWLRKVRPIYRSIREDHSNIDGRVGETFGGIRVVRAFRREKREQKGYSVGHHTMIRKGLLATRIELVLEAAWGLLIPLSTLMLVWYGASLVPKGAASVGSIFAYQIYAVLLLAPVWKIVQSVSQTQKSLAAMERIFGLLEMPSDKPDPPDAIDAPKVVRTFELQNVSFEYRSGVKVIDDFSLPVCGGMTVALVGPSGAGKTTLTDLVARFHDPTSGQILLNGIDLRRIKLKSYRSLLAVVQQETFLFDGTVAENISYGRRTAREEDIRDAARRANAHEFIEQLPDGYDTNIGERGFKLSGGQRQRISIARAILADPAILILDEATSNLDTESEQLIQQSLAELYRNRTTFVIAHRLSTVTHADLIVAMDGGRIVETGTHEQLVERRGFYFEMVERQRRSFGALSEA
jgi:ATP-binding cassette subfamily B protein/subfamily B ATP-binding cassette protein MsbA